MSNELIEDRALVPCLADSVAGEGLKTVRLCPWGTVESKRGTFLLDEEGGRAIVEAFDKHETPVVIDWEHQTLGGKDASPTGRAPAAGWIRKLWVERDRGLYGLVEWLDEARDAIRSKAYQFLSPVIAVRRADGRVMGLHSIGLTNKPAIPAMEALAASNRLQETEYELMPQDEGTEGQGGGTANALLGQLATMLEVPADASAGNMLRGIIEAVKKILGKESGEDSEVASSVRELLGLEADASKSEVLLAMKMQESTELQSMREGEATRLATEHVHKYMAEGKLNPNDKPVMEAALSLARENPERLDALMANAVPNPPPGKTTAPPRYGRHRTITQAVRQYRDDAQMQKSCSEEAAVALALREAGLSPLSEDESRELVTA